MAARELMERIATLLVPQLLKVKEVPKAAAVAEATQVMAAVQVEGPRDSVVVVLVDTQVMVDFVQQAEASMAGLELVEDRFVHGDIIRLFVLKPT